MKNNISVTIDTHYFAIRITKNTIILQYISAITTLQKPLFFIRFDVAKIKTSLFTYSKC